MKTAISRGLGLGVVLMAAMATPGFAHHSTAMFDTSKTVTLQGTVKELQWTNPHSWIQVVAADSKEWSVECGSPNTLSRRGWTKTSLKPGDKVTVIVRPMKDGSSAGLLVNVTTASGKVLSDAPPPGGAPAAAAK